VAETLLLLTVNVNRFYMKMFVIAGAEGLNETGPRTTAENLDRGFKVAGDHQEHLCQNGKLSEHP
jgi:hypothetical protein